MLTHHQKLLRSTDDVYVSNAYLKVVSTQIVFPLVDRENGLFVGCLVLVEASV